MDIDSGFKFREHLMGFLDERDRQRSKSAVFSRLKPQIQIFFRGFYGPFPVYRRSPVGGQYLPMLPVADHEHGLSRAIHPHDHQQKAFDQLSG